MRIEVPIYPWDLQPVPVEVSSTSLPEPNLVSSFEQPPAKPSLLHHRSSSPTKFQRTPVLTISSVQQTERATSSTSSSLTSSSVHTNIASFSVSSFRKIPVSDLSSVPSAVPTTIVAPVVKVHSGHRGHKGSTTTTSTLALFDGSSTTHPAASTTPSSCAGNEAEFIINVKFFSHEF